MKHPFTSMLVFTLVATSAFAQDAKTVPDEKRIASDSHAMSAIFGDSHIADNAFTVHRRAMKMPVEARYEYLADWVLPNSQHNTIRTAIAFSPTHPAPPVQGENQSDTDRLRIAEEAGLSRVQIGGHLVAPAIDLVEVAKELGRLDEVRERADQFVPANDKQKRSRLAMLIAIGTEQGDFRSARGSLQALLSLVQTGGHSSFAERCPETLAIWAALRHPENRDGAQSILYHLVSQQLRLNVYSGVPEWEVHLQAMWSRANELNQETDDEPNKSFGMPPALQQWSGTNRVLSISRGGGSPQAHWKSSAGRVENLAIHSDDYLFFQSPLRGNFEVECDISPFAWRDSTIYVAGKWVAPVYTLTSYRIGNVRGEQPRRPLPQKIGKPREWFRYRAVVRDKIFSTYINGRKIHDEPLPTEHEPWLAIRSVLRNAGVTRGLRITGNPVIPESVRISALPELPGWMPYFKESVGSQNSSWRQSGISFLGGGIVGIRKSMKAQMGTESLLYYVRPMLEDGEIDYEFYYQEGQTLTHPALDRLALILDTDGVRIHWITDGKYDRTDLDPMNVTDEPENRRGPTDLPLKDNAWNRMKLSLVGNTIHLSLNGEEVYERELEATNQRTFGLFHYSDRSEARVRNIVWKGDWPRELPSVEDQELADEGTDFLDADLENLTAVFEHNFAIAGLQNDRIRVFGRGWQPYILEQADGVKVTRTGELGRYITDTIAPRCVIRGDFDATVSYKNFETTLPQVTKETKCSLILTALLDDESQSQCSLLRRTVRRKGRDDDRLVQGMLLQTAHGQDRRTYFGSTTFEAESGTLRLARRGKEMYFLIAEGDSSYFHLIAKETLSDADVRPDGIHIQSHIYGPGASSVTWTKVTIRAEEIVDSAAAARAQTIVGLQKQLTGDLPSSALEFDGRTQFVSIPSIRYDGSHPITLETYVTHDNFNSIVVGDTQKSGLAIGVPSKQYNMHAWNGNNYNAAVSSNVAPTNVRIHLAGTFDGKSLAVFVNGKLLKTAPLRETFGPSGFPLTIGASPSPNEPGLDYAFDGVIDAVRVSKIVRYTKDFEPPAALTNDEDTLAVYEFKEGQGQTLHDSSGNEHHGEIRGAKWVGGNAIRHRAALGLAEFGGEVVKLLIVALKHQNPDVQVEAATALGLIGQDAKSAGPALNELAKDDDQRVSTAAHQAIAAIERSPLIESLKNLFR